MKKRLRRLIALFMSLAMLLGTVPLISYAESINPTMTSYPRGNDPDWGGQQSFATWGNEALSFNNGWKIAGVSQFTNLFSIGYHQTVYCVEPGTSIETPGQLTSNGTVDWEKVASRNDSLNAAEIETVLSQVLYYGYHNDGSDTTTWYKNNGGGEKIAYCYATQLLVWETIVGERDASFNHKAVSGCDHVTDMVKPAHPLHDRIMYYYGEIERKVQNDIVMPASCRATRAAAEADSYEIKYGSGGYVIEFSESSYSGFDITLLPQEGKSSASDNIRWEVNNGKLKIIAKTPFLGKETLKISKKYTTGSVLIYSDGLYTLGEGKQDVITYGSQTSIPKEKEYYISVECPHRHVFIPLMKQPTCCEEGYTVWKCGCGFWTTENPHTGEDSHVAPTGHDYENATWVVSQKATCTENGEEILLCGKCGTVIDKRPIAATKHDSGVWKVDIEATPEREGQMTLYCTKCGEVLDTRPFAYHIHVEGHKEIITQPTCTENGTEGVYCEFCNACYKFNNIPKTGHCSDDKIIWVTSSPAACTTNGEAAGFCANCGEIITSKELPATGHKAFETVTTVFPTCETDGEEITLCSVCGETVASDTIECTGHEEGVWTVTRDASCTVAGEKSLVCKSCGYVFKTEPIEPTGHDNGTWKMDYDATPEHDGQKSRYCTKCNCVLETQKFEVHTHTEGYRKNVVDPTCTDKGQEGVFCATCGAQYMTNDLDALGHDYSEYFSNGDGTHSRTCSRCHYVDSSSCRCDAEIHEANCIDYGYTKHTCSVCGYTYNDNLVNALGHDWSRFVDDENGVSHTAVCERCGISETSAHLWGEWRLIERNVLERTMKYERKCEVCGALQYSITNLIDEPHGHTMEKFDAVPPTCTEDGSAEYYHCTDPDCDCYYSDPSGENEIEPYSWIIPAHGHNYVLKENVPATCTEDGYVYYECTHDASHNYKEIIPAHGHNYVEKERVEPTCTEDGYIYYECTHDASHNYKVILPAHDHDYHLIPEKCKDATPDEPGYYYYECSHDPDHYYLKTIYYVGNTGSGKSAAYDEETGVATITLNSSTGSKEISYKQTTPLDIVLVVDQSGSMADKLSKGTETKQKALKNAAQSFVEKVSAEAAESGADHRIAVVGFAMGSQASGKDYPAYMNTAILSTGGVAIQYNKARDKDFANALKSVNVNGALNADITKAVSSIQAKGATAADCGLEMAKLIFNNTDSANRQRVVVFMTDGSPTYASSFDNAVANYAIGAANELKAKYSALVYSVGVDVGSEKNMTNFMNAVSSNYPDATSLNKMGDKIDSESAKYYISVDDEKGLTAMFKSIEQDVFAPSKPFENITLVDTISKEFTMTVEQETALRNSVCSDYGIDNGDILVSRNADGTTTVEIRNLDPKTELDASGKPVKYYVNVSFDVTANQYAQGKSYYNTNTDYAGVIIDGIMVDKFSSPRVSVNDDRNIVAFTVGDEVYAISEANIGDEIIAPGFDNIKWNIPDGFTVSDKYTEITGTFTSETKTVTWVYDGGSKTESYHVGERIKVFDVPAAEGKAFLGWDKSIPFEMGGSSLTFTANYEVHTHSFAEISQYGSCDEGITYVYGCSCGETYKTISEPCAHQYSASLTNSEGKCYAVITCENCGHTEQKYITYQAMFDNEEIDAERENGTGTSQIFDIKMYDANDVSVQPDGSISIVIPATSQMLHDDNLKIYRINEDGTRDEIAFDRNPESETLTMTVDHFSYYLITASEEFLKENSYKQINCAFADGHIDKNNDGICDDCGMQTETNGCKHICHSQKWFVRFFWIIGRFFCKIFKIHKYCDCSMRHY